MGFKRFAVTVGVLVSVTSVAACSVDGTAIREAADLDTGQYSTELNEPAGNADTDEEKARLQGNQLGEYMLFRDDLAPELTEFGMPTYSVTPEQGMAGIFSEPASKTTAKLKYGFTVTGSADSAVPGKKSVNYAVFVYDTPQTASEAVKEITEGMLKVDPDDGPHQRTTIPGMPSITSAVTFDMPDKSDPVAALTPVGTAVIYTWATSLDKSWTRRIIRDGYTKQKALIDGMPPVNTSTEIDPTGILRAVIPLKPNSLSMEDQVVGPRTIAQLSGRSAKQYRDLKEAGVTHAALGAALVLETGDDAQAAALAVKLAYDSDNPTVSKAASPRDLPAATCTTSARDYDAATCVVTVGKYVAQITADDLLDAQQKTAAEYELLKQL